MSEVHPQARTTPRTRAEIKASAASVAELAGRYNITEATVRKWKTREAPEDPSHRPHKLSTTLTVAQEAIVVELRRLVLLPLDDLLVITREFINPQASRSGFDRCLRRHGVANLRELQADLAGKDTVPPKTFKDYEPGIVHVDIKYLPQMPDESARRYLFVAIDRATRWVYLRLYAQQSEASSTDFLRRLSQAAPMKIQTVLTDNDSQFTGIASPARPRPPVVSMRSTVAARHSASSTDSARPDTCRPTAWASVSTAASARSLDRPGSSRPTNWKPRSPTTWPPTTTAFPNARSTTFHPFRPSSNGVLESRNCSSIWFTNRRDLKFSHCS